MPFRRRQFHHVFNLVDIRDFSETPGSISANDAVVLTESWTDLETTDFILADMIDSSGTDTDVWVNARCITDGTLQVVYRNEGAGAEDPGTVSLRVIALKLRPGASDS